MTRRGATLAILSLLLGGCERRSDLAAEIGRIRAIDHHAHPVRVVAEGERDREFDALPVDNMEPASDPMFLRPDDAGVAAAKHAMFSAPKQQMMRDKGDAYPAWVLDQMGVDVMFANRVAMGRGIAPPRFVWVPYADALLFPLNNSGMAVKNPDRKAFFSFEDALLQRYLKEAGLAAPPRQP